MNKKHGTIILSCKGCGSEKKMQGGVRGFICSDCVSKTVASPEIKSTGPKEKRPRGWHKKARFVSDSGKVYNYGVLENENDAKSGEGVVDGNDIRPTADGDVS